MAAPSADSSGLRLFAASAKNLMPRLISYLGGAAAAAFFLGPFWTSIWFIATWIAVFAGIGLMRLIQDQPATPRAVLLGRILMVNNVWNAVIQCLLAAALVATGEPLAQACGLVGLFISASYVLQYYYADLKTFGLLMAPHVAITAFIGWRYVSDAGYPVTHVVAVAGAGVMLVNYFHLARQILNGSRNALRKATAKAREGGLAAEAANAAKSTFLATMSHEIRTPLNGVLGMAQAMAVGELAPAQRERLMVIHQSGEALLAILNDILDLSKIEAGKLEMESIAFDLGAVARGAHQAFTGLAEAKGLHLAVDVAAAEGTYRGDPTRIRQILYNLISNALKFTEAGEIRVVGERVDEAVRFTVSDTGLGIPPEALARLFSAFSQVDASTTRRFGGTGLGLALCRQFAELMGGTIAVESQVGRGSRFIVTLPLERLGEAQAPSGPEAESAPAGQLGAVRVLAAEDNPVNRLVLKTLLEQVGVEPIFVEDGEAALDAWAGGDWDIILMDVQMPTMDGPTATRLIRERERASGRRRTPIVALTANAMSHQIAEYLAAGMDGHVAKPIEAARLFEALEAAMAPPAAESGDASAAA